MQRYAQKVAPLWLAPLAALTVAGCGGLLTGRGLNLTGGSVPVGTSKAAIIVDPGDQNTSQSGAAGDPQVTLTLVTTRLAPLPPTGHQVPPPDPTPDPTPAPTPSSGPIQPVNPGGTSVGGYKEFLFEKLPAGHYLLKAGTTGSSGHAPFEWEFDLPGSTVARFVASLAPADFDPDAVGEVQVSPKFLTVSPGETVRFFGGATDVFGSPISQPVSFMLVGDTGDLRPGGMLTARRVGKSVLTAWMAGKSASAEVTVVP